MISPGQARDKHRASTQKDYRLLRQFKDVRSQLLPNPDGKGGVIHVNITRNYTYHVGKQPDAAGKR